MTTEGKPITKCSTNRVSVVIPAFCTHKLLRGMTETKPAIPYYSYTQTLCEMLKRLFKHEQNKVI